MNLAWHPNFEQTLQNPSHHFSSKMANRGITKLLLLLVQKRCLNTLSTHPPPSLAQSSNFTLDFLTNSCGLPLKSTISVSQKFQFQENKEKKLQSVINYLRDEGFTQTHIAKLVQKRPDVLSLNVETILKPKLEFLKQNGFVGELLTELLIRNPTVVGTSLDSQLKPCFELLKYYVKSDDKVVFAVRRAPWLLSFNIKNILQPNIDFLVKEGVPSTSLAKIITFQPRAITFKHSKTVYTVNAVKNSGFQPTSPMFVYAFTVMIQTGESTWKKKMEFLQSFGWTENEFLTAFKRFPCIMQYSVGKIRKSMDFYLNTMKLDVHTITTNPTLLGFAIDTRVRPRYIVFKILKSKKLIKEDTQMLPLLQKTDKEFLGKYVIKYQEIIPDLLETYNTSKNAEMISDETRLGSAK